MSYATINDFVFKFCDKRDKQSKIYIYNKYKVNKIKETYQCLNENEFMNLMRKDIENKKYFLAYYSDEARKITELYNNNIQYDNKDNFVLVIADSKIQINDAEQEFKNKYVYYSPLITYGIDYNNEKKTKYVYIYSGNIDITNSFI